MHFHVQDLNKLLYFSITTIPTYRLLPSMEFSLSRTYA